MVEVGVRESDLKEARRGDIIARIELWEVIVVVRAEYGLDANAESTIQFLGAFSNHVL